METQYKEQMKLVILLAVVCTATVIVMIVAYGIYHFRININSTSVSKSGINYSQASIISKLDTNGKNTKVQVIGDVQIEQTRMINVAGTSILTSKVTNIGAAKENLRFKVKLLGSDGSTLAEVMGYVGKIKTNETKYIDSYISKNVLNAKDIEYKLL